MYAQLELPADARLITRGMECPSSLRASEVRSLARYIGNLANTLDTRDRFLHKLESVVKVTAQYMQKEWTIFCENGLCVIVPQYEPFSSLVRFERFNSAGLMFLDNGTQSFAYANLGNLMVDIANGTTHRGYALTTRMLDTGENGNA